MDTNHLPRLILTYGVCDALSIPQLASLSDHYKIQRCSFLFFLLILNSLWEKEINVM